jgi:hypothetical protein
VKLGCVQGNISTQKKYLEISSRIKCKFKVKYVTQALLGRNYNKNYCTSLNQNFDYMFFKVIK